MPSLSVVLRSRQSLHRASKLNLLPFADFHYFGSGKTSFVVGGLRTILTLSHSTYALADAPTAGLWLIASAVGILHFLSMFCGYSDYIIMKWSDFRARRTPPPLATTESVRCFGVALYRAQTHIVAFWAALIGRIHCLRLGVNLERHTAKLAATLSAESCAGLSYGTV